MNNNLSCPVCEKVNNIGTIFCDKCGWEFRYFVTTLNESDKQRENKRLEIAKRNWQLINQKIKTEVVKEEEYNNNNSTLFKETNKVHSITNDVVKVEFKYIEPESIEWHRDTFETEEEYKERINNLIWVKIGTIDLKKEDYNIENNRFNFTIKWNETYKRHIHKDLILPYINIEREQAKKLFQLMGTHNVYTKLTYDKGISTEKYILKFNDTDFLIHFSNNRCLKTLEGHKYSVNSVNYSPVGEYIASGSGDETIKIWDVNSGICIKTLQGHEKKVTNVSYSPDGKYIASGSRDETIKIWDVNSGICVKTLQGRLDSNDFITYSPDGKYLVSRGYFRNEIVIFKVSSGECIKILHGHKSNINGVSYSPDGKYIASGSYDDTIKIWEVSSGSCIKTIETFCDGVRTISYSPDGRYLASGSRDNKIKIWEVSSGTCVKSLLGHEKWLNIVSYSPDGKYIASGSGDKKVKVWEISSGECIRTFEGSSNFGGESVSFSPNGKYLISTSYKYIKIWYIGD